MFSHDDLHLLLAETAGPAISLYLPTHIAGRETRQDPIRMRNLLDRAKAMLEQRGMRPSDAADLLNPGYRLLDEALFWRHQSEGLAVFISPLRMLVHHLPVRVEEMVEVNGRFRVRPLLPLLNGDGWYAVLTISLSNARLWEGSRSGLHEVPLEKLPRDTAALFGGDVSPDDGTVRIPDTANAGSDMMGNYLTQLASAVKQYLGGYGTPLVLVADDRLAGHFIQISKYKHLIQPPIQQPPETLSHEELHRRSFESVRPVFEQVRRDSLDRYRMLAGDGSGRGITDVAEIVSAAVQGRIDQLFIRDGAECWGRYLSDAARAVAHTQRQEGDQELLDLAAAHVMDKDGHVYEMPPEQMPVSTPVAATLRF